MRPRPAAVVALLAPLVLAAAGPVSAQSPPPVPENRPPFQLGPVGVRPRLAVTNFGRDNNVFNEADDPKSDFTFTATPDVELSIEPGRFRLSSTAGIDWVYFKTYTSERTVNRRFSGRAEVDLNVLQPFASAVLNHTSARPNSEVDVRGRHHPKQFEAGTGVRLSTRTSAGFTIRSAIEDYDENTMFRGVDLATTLNNTTTSYEVSVGQQLTPLTGVSLVTSIEQMRFDHSPLRDSDTIRIAPTVTFSPMGLLNGSASAGYRWFTGKSDSLADYRGFIANGSIGLALEDRFRIEGTFTRDVKYWYEEALPYYILNGGRGTFTVLLAGGFDVRVTGGRESMGYRAYVGAPSPDADHQTLYGGGIGYHLTDTAHLMVEAEFIDRTSPRDRSREYSNDRIFASLTWGTAIR